MTGLLAATPLWFVLFLVFIMGGCITVLGGYFLWSIKMIFSDLRESIKELKDLIGSLFDKHDDHESRLSTLEGHIFKSRKKDDNG